MYFAANVWWIKDIHQCKHCNAKHVVNKHFTCFSSVPMSEHTHQSLCACHSHNDQVSNAPAHCNIIATALQQHCNIIATSLQHHCNDKVATFCLACAAVQHRWLTKRKMAREGGRSWHPAHAYAKQHDITTADVTVVTLWWRSVCKCLQFSQQLSFTLFPRNLNTRTNTYSLTSMSMSIVNLRSTESWSISTAISVFNYNSRNNSAF